MDGEKPQKVPPFSFFRHCEIFSENYFLSKGSPFNFFDILQHIGCLKIPKGPLFQFFGIVRFFSKICFFSKGFLLQLQQKCRQFRKCPSFSAPGARASGPRRATQSIFLFFEKKFDKISKKKILRFLSLRYGADFRRSRLVLFVGPVFSLSETSSQYSVKRRAMLCKIV